jgi:hypothetical protein
MARIALTGGAYTARSLVASAQRSVNLYLEPIPEAQGEPSRAALYPTAGLRKLCTLPEGGIRGGKRMTDGSVYVVAGKGVYKVAPDWTSTHLGDITAGRVTPVSIADNGTTAIIVDGSVYAWTIDLAAATLTRLVDPTNTFSGADKVDYLDTYFIFNKPGTPQFFISGSNDTTFDPVDFANKESYSDILMTLAVAKREVWLIGSQTTEIWYNVGQSDITDFAFQSMPGVFIDRGTVAKYSVAVTDDAVYWLTQDRGGTGSILAGAGYEAKPISTFAMEAEFARYPRIDDAIGWTHQIAGHRFYTIAFPHADKTWSYDITTSSWHEAVWLDTNGTEHRHRANCAFTGHGEVICGDWENGNLYAYDVRVFTDDGAPVKRLRHYPHLLNDGKRLFYRQFIADIEGGTGGGTTFPEPPQVFLAWSDDRGHKFGNPVGQDIGETGDYVSSVQYQRLGMGRDRVFQLQWSTPYPTVLQGAWIVVEAASS